MFPWAKMWKLLCLLLWLGLCSGLQQGLEYHYRYSGRLATGITQLKHQFAAVGIKADITIQVVGNRTFIIKFDHVETGDFHGDHDCDLRLPIPIAYEALQDGTEALQKPFRVSVSSKETAYLEVAQDEASWITNIRRSVVNILPFGTLWGEIVEGEFQKSNFGKMEQLMGGTCMSWYTITKTPSYDAFKINQERESVMEEDVQREGGDATSAGYKSAKGHPSGGGAKGRGRKGSKTSIQQTPARLIDVPYILDDLWTVTRTVDYDYCNHLVEVKLNSNKEVDGLIARTSASRYLLRGDAEGLRLEMAEVVGGVSVFTSDASSDHIDTLTNQTLELHSVRLISHRLEIDFVTERISSWQYEVDDLTPHGGSEAADLQERLAGIHMGSLDFESIKSKTLSLLNKLSTNPEHLVHAMDDVVEAVSRLGFEDIKGIYEELQVKLREHSEIGDEMRTASENINNFDIALVLAGTQPAVQFLLDQMEANVGGRPENSLFFFFKQIETTLKAPSLVPRITNLAMSLSWNQPEDLAKTLALTTSGSLADKFCLNAERRNTFRDATFSGESSCNTEEVISSFIPYLKEGVQNFSAPVWQRVIDMQALINLGTPLSIEILQPIILGIEEEYTGLRTTAISSLSAHLLPMSALGQVYDILMPIIENRGENPDVRSAAFLAMTSWKPGITWWKHMAVSTWSEPSVQVAHLVSTTIQSIADGDDAFSQMMSRVLYLTKPAVAISVSYSSSVHLHNYLNSGHLDKGISIIWFANTEGIIPTHIYITYQLQRLHGFSSPSKISINQRGLDFFLQIIKQYRDQFRYGDGRTDAQGLLFDLVMELTGELDLYSGGFPMNAELFLESNKNFVFGKVLDFFRGGMIFGFIREIQRHLPTGFEDLWYDKSIDTSFAYPTDLGIPCFVKYSAELALKVTTSDVEVPRPTDLPPGSSGLKIALRASQETSIKAYASVPWTDPSPTRVESGIRCESNVHLPFKVDVGGKGSTLQAILRIILEEGLFIEASNDPFTTLSRSKVPTPALQEKEYKWIHKEPGSPFRYERNDRIAPWTGLWLEHSWSGDVDAPSMLDIIRGKFSFFTPTLHNWRYSLAGELRSSDTKNITFIFTLAKTEKKSLPEVGPDYSSLGQESQGPADYSSLGQESQGPADYSDYSQFSQSASLDYSQFSQESGLGEEATGLEGDLQKAMLHITQMQDAIPAGYMISFSGRMIMQGSVKHARELVLTLAEEKKVETRKTTLKTKFYYDIPIGITTLNHTISFNAHLESPNIRPLATLSEVLHANLGSTLQAQLYSDEGSPALQIEGSFEVTEKQRSVIREKLDNKCDYQVAYPVKDLISSQMYDKGNINIQWTEDFPESHWVRGLYETAHGCLQAASRSCDYSDSGYRERIQVRTARDPDSSHVTAQVSYPDKHCSYDFSLPFFLGYPGSALGAFIHNAVNGRNPAICAVKNNEVLTFDGATFPFTPNNCWKIVALEKVTSELVLQVRYTEGWEAKVMWRERGLIFQMTNSEIKEDGDTDLKSGGTYETFVHPEEEEGEGRGGWTLLALDIGIAVKVSFDKVEIEMPFHLRSKVSGLCGFYNGEKRFEMIGPKGCLFKDPELFASAFEVSGDGCNAFSLRGRRKKVGEYQENCPRQVFVPTGISHEKMQSDCITWEYHEKREGHCKCKSLVPTPACSYGCSSSSLQKTELTYDCTPVEGHEDESTNCHPRKFTTEYNINCKRT